MNEQRSAKRDYCEFIQALSWIRPSKGRIQLQRAGKKLELLSNYIYPALPRKIHNRKIVWETILPTLVCSFFILFTSTAVFEE